MNTPSDRKFLAGLKIATEQSHECLESVNVHQDTRLAFCAACGDRVDLFDLVLVLDRRWAARVGELEKRVIEREKCLADARSSAEFWRRHMFLMAGLCAVLLVAFFMVEVWGI